MPRPFPQGECRVALEELEAVQELSAGRGSRQRSGALMRGNLGHQRAEIRIIKEKRSRAWRSRDVGNQGAEIWGIKEQRCG